MGEPASGNLAGKTMISCTLPRGTLMVLKATLHLKAGAALWRGRQEAVRAA